jgi:hypothetical protein
MAAPTLVASYATAWNTTTSPKMVSVTTNPDDQLIVAVVTADAATDLDAPTGGSLVYTEYSYWNQSLNCRVFMWGADANAATTFNVSITKTSGTDDWGFVVLRFSGSLGFGENEYAVGSGSPALALTTFAENPAIVEIIGDWNAVSGGTRTWNTVNGNTPTAANSQEVVYSFVSGAYTVYIAYITDAGSYGSTASLGMSAPTGQQYTIKAIEVFGDTPPGVAAGKTSPNQQQLAWSQRM